MFGTENEKMIFTAVKVSFSCRFSEHDSVKRAQEYCARTDFLQSRCGQSFFEVPLPVGGNK